MAGPHALRLFAGPAARRLIEREGLQAHHVRVVPGAAGGPKGLVLGPMDRYIFGQWLGASKHPVDLVGASIGAWRMATACLPQPVPALERLEHDYIHQNYPVPPGKSRPLPRTVSQRFGENLRAFFGDQVGALLAHPRWRLHVLASRGLHLLGRPGPWRTPLGYLGAAASNALHRPALGAWMERSVFSAVEPARGPRALAQAAALPFASADLRTRQLALTEANFDAALQASCAIPFALEPVQGIAGAPPGAYWDGGVTDYHLHLDYRARADSPTPGLVLYPHFQRQVVPGWLDKHLPWRHRRTAFLDHVLLLAPDPQWVARLPRAKLPDRTDFVFHGTDLAARVRQWQAVVAASVQLAEEFSRWAEQPDLSRLEAL